MLCIHRAANCLEETKKALVLLKERIATAKPKRLCAAVSRCFFVFTDAAFEEDAGLAGIGAVLVGPHGR